MSALPQPLSRLARSLVVVPAFALAVLAGLGEFARLQGWRLREHLPRLPR